MLDCMTCPACGYQNRDDYHYCTQCGTRLDDAPKRHGRLVVISEPDKSQHQRRRGGSPKPKHERRLGIEIAQPSLLIGRNDDNILIINDDQASAYHAKISADDLQFWIEDLGSTNGTYIDGVRIHARTLLSPECLIKIGSTILKFEYFPTETAG